MRPPSDFARKTVPKGRLEKKENSVPDTRPICVRHPPSDPPRTGGPARRTCPRVCSSVCARRPHGPRRPRPALLLSLRVSASRSRGRRRPGANPIGSARRRGAADARPPRRPPSRPRAPAYTADYPSLRRPFRDRGPIAARVAPGWPGPAPAAGFRLRLGRTWLSPLNANAPRRGGQPCGQPSFITTRLSARSSYTPRKILGRRDSSTPRQGAPRAAGSH